MNSQTRDTIEVILGGKSCSVCNARDVLIKCLCGQFLCNNCNLLHEDYKKCSTCGKKYCIFSKCYHN